MPSPFFKPFVANNIAKSGIKSATSLTTIISNLEKTISTINQVIPIYKEVKPLVVSSKGFLTTIGSYFKKSNTNTNKEETIIDAKIIEKENKKNEEVNTINITSPSKAFFI